MLSRREMAEGKEIWVIKASFPNTQEKRQWSDHAFANSLKKYLEELGHYVVVESRDEWETKEAADVVIALRGWLAYYPDRRNKDCIYILWNLSHSSTITDEEYNAYDVVCTGSEKEIYVRALRERLKVPVKTLPMCVDTKIFYPDKGKAGEKMHDWVFVGNSRDVERKSVSWSIKHRFPIKIWGGNWERFIPESKKYVVSDCISNDNLPELYRSAKVTVDDHRDDMIENGFMNTRVLEALACGLPIISDYSETLEEQFGASVLYYRNEEEFVEQAHKVFADYDKIKEKTLLQWPKIQERYSFEASAEKLDDIKNEMQTYAKACEKAVETLQEQDSKELLQNSAVCRVWTEFNFIREKMQAEETPASREELCGTWEKLREQFGQLSWQEQKAFRNMKGIEGFLFEVQLGVLSDIEKQWKRIEGERQELQKLYAPGMQGGETYSDCMKRLSAEKKEMVAKLQRAYEEKSKLNEKLQRTYAEKSEINRKLQITYGEKYERGLEIKQLKKELESVRKSRTYRLARMMGLPVRIFRKLVKKIKGVEPL